ncbi:hypothetical protein [Anabaena sp. PCC 7108]|uniref:hypothetical protein n=1 Tax=Anabaena sp. PCC 7108 TaxID=163908 RepID=UPI00034905C7|nr:hypothetical protein [Anabaena sp. PCC 7108]
MFIFPHIKKLRTFILLAVISFLVMIFCTSVLAKDVEKHGNLIVRNDNSGKKYSSINTLTTAGEYSISYPSSWENVYLSLWHYFSSFSKTDMRFTTWERISSSCNRCARIELRIFTNDELTFKLFDSNSQKLQVISFGDAVKSFVKMRESTIPGHKIISQQKLNIHGRQAVRLYSKKAIEVLIDMGNNTTTVIVGYLLPNEESREWSSIQEEIKFIQESFRPPK